jgi:hypothetical protein
LKLHRHHERRRRLLPAFRPCHCHPRLIVAPFAFQACHLHFERLFQLHALPLLVLGCQLNRGICHLGLRRRSCCCWRCIDHGDLAILCFIVLLAFLGPDLFLGEAHLHAAVLAGTAVVLAKVLLQPLTTCAL